jgi:hypothetical protein
VQERRSEGSDEKAKEQRKPGNQDVFLEVGIEILGKPASIGCRRGMSIIFSLVWFHERHTCGRSGGL